MGTETKKDITRLAFAALLIVGLGVSGTFLQTPVSGGNTAAANDASEWINPDTGTVGAPQQAQTQTETTQWTNPDARRGGQNIPFGTGTNTREVEVENENTPTTSRVSVATDLLTQALQTCDADGTGNCKNRCSTSFVTPSIDGFRVTDCYASNVPNAPVRAVLKLQQCIERETGETIPGNADIAEVKQGTTENTVRFVESPMKQALCIADLPKLFLRTCESGSCPIENTVLDPDSETQDGKTVFAVPEVCEPELDAIVKLRNLSTAHSNATAAEALVCAHKGPVVCYPNDFSDTTKGYTCVPKDPKLRTGVSGISGAPGTSGSRCSGTFTQRMECEIRGVTSRTSQAWTSVGIAIGQGIGGAFTRWNSSNRSSSNRSGSSAQGCSAGYVKAVVDGRTVCKKEGTAVPQCLLDASKKEILSGETVVIRWRTASSETVSISGIGADLPKSSETTIRPAETTTYELTATGSGDDNIKMCEVTVVVEGSDALGPTGSSPPQLSCVPNTIRKDRPSTLKWACTTAATSSQGIGIDTEGKVSGEVTVTPDHNEEYAVQCLDEDGIEIGRNTCAVTVGEPQYDIVVEPEEAERGDRVRVAWSSLFMKSCKVTGPRGFGYTNPQGVVITEPFSFDKESVPDRQIRAAIYTLECESEFGTQATKDVTVEFKPED
ncbi:hypothetical protein JXR01_02520 [Candidatus Kaiserbacteria bacterium]|nr:MAG: hypothetical protein JXR01_02520 [Candidatus Kaiserbacteria bacterium]